jgi:hypothetical protein
MIDLTAARAYNKSKSGTLWNLADLPWPYKANDPGSEAFAQLIAAFQQAHALKMDGCLGPATLATIRAVMAEGLPATDTQPVHGPVNKPNTIPGRLGSSNLMVIGSQLVATPFSCTNFFRDGETKFKCWPRKPEKVTHLCIHESVTRDAATTVRVLSQEGYGTHLMICPDGHVSQHNDLLLEQPAHANQLNGCSIGIEVVNPYSPLYAKPPFTRTIPATWWTWVPAKAPRQYTTPTDAQMAALLLLVPWLTQQVPTVPLRYPTSYLNGAEPKIPGWDKGNKPLPGIVAHSDFSSHADGRYELEALIAARVSVP